MTFYDRIPKSVTLSNIYNNLIIRNARLLHKKVRISRLKLFKYHLLSKKDVAHCIDFSVFTLSPF